MSSRTLTYAQACEAIDNAITTFVEAEIEAARVRLGNLERSAFDAGVAAYEAIRKARDSAKKSDTK